MVAEHVRDGLFPIHDCLEEIAEVVDKRAVLINVLEFAVGQRIRSELFHGCTAQPTTVDEDATLGPFEQNPIVAVMANFNLFAVLERRLDEEFCGCVVL